MPILNTESKKALLGNAVKVYKAYAGLDFFKQSFDINGTITTLEQFCNQLIKSGEISKREFKLDQQNYNIEIKEKGLNKYSLHFSILSSLVNKANIKQLVDYKTYEKIQCLENLPLELNINKKNNYCLSVVMPNGDLLGGPTKFDLYNTHLFH